MNAGSVAISYLCQDVAQTINEGNDYLLVSHCASVPQIIAVSVPVDL